MSEPLPWWPLLIVVIIEPCPWPFDVFMVNTWPPILNLALIIQWSENCERHLPESYEGSTWLLRSVPGLPRKAVCASEGDNSRKVRLPKTFPASAAIRTFVRHHSCLTAVWVLCVSWISTIALDGRSIIGYGLWDPKKNFILAESIWCPIIPNPVRRARTLPLSAQGVHYWRGADRNELDVPGWFARWSHSLYCRFLWCLQS